MKKIPYTTRLKKKGKCKICGCSLTNKIKEIIKDINKNNLQLYYGDMTLEQAEQAARILESKHEVKVTRDSPYNKTVDFCDNLNHAAIRIKAKL